MLDALKFVLPAVAKKENIRPVLTHFLIRNRTVAATNGRLALCSPVDIDLEMCPRAEDFARAVGACEDSILLHLNTAGKVVVRSGHFKTHVDCAPISEHPLTAFLPSGRRIELTDSFLPALTHLEKFVSPDDSRSWAQGILFDGESAYATNNIVLIQFWLGYKFPCRVNIPLAAVRELLRVGENPVALQVNDRNVTFYFSDGRYLITVLYSEPWPNVAKLFANDYGQGQKPFPAGFWEALEKLAPFFDDMGRTFFHDGVAMATTATLNDSGASVLCPGVPNAGIYNGRALLNLRPVANTIGFDAYPAPVFFYGDASRGIISGIVPQ